MPIDRTALPLSSAVCSGEHRTVERFLLQVPGVVTALVNPASEMVYVEYNPARTDPNALSAVLKQAGFVPSGQLGGCGARRFRGDHLWTDRRGRA